MARKNYRNGDEVNMDWNSCDGCSPSMINGLFCHETGCPEAWRDIEQECHECGGEYYRTWRFQTVCQDCEGAWLEPVEEEEDST